MTIESQRGATRYRISPDNPCAVQIQTGPGRSWFWHSEYSTPAEARAVVMALARPPGAMRLARPQRPQPEQEAKA